MAPFFNKIFLKIALCSMHAFVEPAEFNYEKNWGLQSKRKLETKLKIKSNNFYILMISTHFVRYNKVVRNISTRNWPLYEGLL
jgi:hypothetical protein